MTAATLRLLGFDAEGARFLDAAGAEHALLAEDLLALSGEGRDARSLQRAPGSLRWRGALTDCAPTDAGWRLAFADGSALVLSRDAVAEALSPGIAQVPARVWRADAAPLPPHDYAAVMGDAGARLACLRQLLARGYARLSGVPAVEGTVVRFLESFGPLRETNYGRLFDVRVRPQPGNLADSALALPPHTDNPYRVTPPDLQALHALASAAEGGETWLVDGLAVVDELRATAPEALALLAEVPVRFTWRDAHWRLEASEPVIALASDGTLRRLRVNARSLDRVLEPDPARRAAWWEAWRKLEACLADPAFALTFTLGAGEMVVMDNRRVLHGRTAFASAPGAMRGERHLQGAYADIDGLTSEVLRLAEARAEETMAELEALFLGPEMAGTYGEAISIRDHMLQSAELAARRGLSEEGIAAALLHDIGWARTETPAPHEHVAAECLQAAFGAAVAEPVRWHVEAKRYLVARQPDYRACLSAASLETLRQQGGPMNEGECAAFEALPGHELFLALRVIDDAGKEALPPRTTWADYRGLLHRLALRHLLER